MIHPIDQFETYLTGGLSDAERAEFEAHLSTCAECTAALEAARTSDQRLIAMFASERPEAGFEDRVIQRFREKQSKRLSRLSEPLKIHPMVRRAAIGIAASL